MSKSDCSLINVPRVDLWMELTPKVLLFFFYFLFFFFSSLSLSLSLINTICTSNYLLPDVIVKIIIRFWMVDLYISHQ
jgi:hypothetical protein